MKTKITSKQFEKTCCGYMDILADMEKRVEELENKREMELSVIIPNFNGRALLEECMQSVVDAAERCTSKYEIIVVDDGSTDNSTNFLMNNFPAVKIIALDKNVGFVKAVNAGVGTATGRFLLILNNDMIPEKDSFHHMIRHFKDPDVFAVSPKVLRSDKSTIQTEFIGCRFMIGTLVLTQVGLNEVDTNKFTEPCLTFYALGCFSMIDRKRFLELGCYDEIYSPFYCEERDVSYNAYKRGWKIMYEPKAIGYHKHRATISKTFKKDYLQLLELRNRFIFTWSNFSDRWILFNHFLALPLVFIRSAFIGQYRSKRFLDVIAFFQALKHWKVIQAKRARVKCNAKLTDRETLKIINSNGANKLVLADIGKHII